jgi:hypothetical protein
MLVDDYAYQGFNVMSNSDICLCGHIRRIHFNPILGGKRRPCSHIKCPCVDFKPASSELQEHDISE